MDRSCLVIIIVSMMFSHLSFIPFYWWQIVLHAMAFRSLVVIHSAVRGDSFSILIWVARVFGIACVITVICLASSWNSAWVAGVVKFSTSCDMLAVTPSSSWRGVCYLDWSLYQVLAMVSHYLWLVITFPTYYSNCWLQSWLDWLIGPIPKPNEIDLELFLSQLEGS